MVAVPHFALLPIGIFVADQPHQHTQFNEKLLHVRHEKEKKKATAQQWNNDSMETNAATINISKKSEAKKRKEIDSICK